jgi:zinc transporter ZupT
MIFNFVVLFLVTFLAGMSVFLVKEIDLQKFKIVLAFSGSYLFSLTVIHILPEAIHESNNFTLTGIFVLLGFFIQLVLVYFTEGIEHGHIHLHDHDIDRQIPYSMFIGLCLHAFLEGMLLYHPSSFHEGHEVGNLLFGLILHKIPESLALMTVLILGMKKRKTGVILLILFSLASPIGLLVSTAFFNLQDVPEQYFSYVFALIAGNFLYISTTIFFENSPNHKFKANRLIVSILGAIGAVVGDHVL